MPLGLEKIEPKEDPFAKIAGTALGAAVVALRAMGHEAQRRLATYPQATSAYRRTGNLGRRWTVKGPSQRGFDVVVTVGNNAKYARPVQGVKQRKRFKDIGWRNVEEVAKEVIVEFEPIITEALKGK